MASPEHIATHNPHTTLDSASRTERDTSPQSGLEPRLSSQPYQYSTIKTESEVRPSRQNPFLPPYTNFVLVHRRGTYDVRDQLAIEFHRTVRVTDCNDTNNLPPSLGRFPLFETARFEKMPPHMQKKGGFFLPMYQREALWIAFSSKKPFAIKIYVGGVNAVSGEAARETEATLMRRLKLLEQKKSIQDYVVAPRQRWLDGIANSDGTVRQFVGMPLGGGYTVEAQISGEEIIGGIQIEVTPRKVLAESGFYEVSITTLTGKRLTMKVSPGHLVDEVKEMIQDREGIPPDQQRLIHDGKQLEDCGTLSSYGVQPGDNMHLVLRLRGGGFFPRGAELGLAVGGLIKQTVVKDPYPADMWGPDDGTVFNVQLVNSDLFKQITGMDPPQSPVTAQAYAAHGYPYFDIYDEKPSGIKGNFHDVKSVNQLDQADKTGDERKAAAVQEVSKGSSNPVVLLDKDGKSIRFRTVQEMEQEVRQRFKCLKV